jgi:hypothetical protein
MCDVRRALYGHAPRCIPNSAKVRDERRASCMCYYEAKSMFIMSEGISTSTISFVLAEHSFFTIATKQAGSALLGVSQLPYFVDILAQNPPIVCVIFCD